MRTKIIRFALLVSTLVFIHSFAQQIPLVYNVENTGADWTKPPLPAVADLPVIQPLTDPFEWSDGSGRSTDFNDWYRRRAEIGAEIENYEIGTKPVRPDTLTAVYSGDTLTVNVTVKGNTLTLKSAITLPEGAGPFPAVIGMGGPTGSLPADIFTTRGIATIPFNFGQVMAWQQVRGQEPINRLYPELTYMGAYSAWSWGVSRLIDGLELVSSELPIDLKHLAVTGCSFAGKMALFAGAFDERIALTIAQESGGGGAAAWRVSETQTGVENLGATSTVWFINNMFKFAGKNVSKLPHDHHELMAMVAPRALLVLGNPDMIWLADTSGYVSCRAAQRVWDTFGISDRFGFSIVGNHPHCAILPVQRPEIEAFVDKFLLGDTTANTDVHTHPWPKLDYSYWTEWWGTAKPEFPIRDRGTSENHWLEAECAAVGSAWEVLQDTLASNGSYITVKDGFKSSSKPPTDISAFISFPFTLAANDTFFIFARVNSQWNVNDAFWLKIDDGNFAGIFGLYTSGWQWKKWAKSELAAGGHTLTVGYRLGKAKLDKICISAFSYPPGEMGEAAENACVSGLDEIESFDSYNLSQNYPNPFNPSTEISYDLPKRGWVTLKVYDVLGKEIMTLVNENKQAGTYRINFNVAGLGSGVYLYQLKAGNYTERKKMIFIK
jgi:hypothetical protein